MDVGFFEPSKDGFIYDLKRLGWDEKRKLGWICDICEEDFGNKN